jgi:hypothetical protein
VNQRLSAARLRPSRLASAESRAVMGSASRRPDRWNLGPPGRPQRHRQRAGHCRLELSYLLKLGAELERRAVRDILSSGSQPQGTEGNPTVDPGMDVANPERQGTRRSGPDVQPVYPRLDQLLQSFLQVGVVSDVTPDRRLSAPVGTTQVQAPAATAEGCSELAGTCGPFIAGPVCPLAASVWTRPDIGSRMS